MRIAAVLAFGIVSICSLSSNAFAAQAPQCKENEKVCVCYVQCADGGKAWMMSGVPDKNGSCSYQNGTTGTGSNQCTYSQCTKSCPPKDGP